MKSITLKCTTLVACILFSSFISNAQIYVGPQAGFTASGLYTDGAGGYSSDVFAGINGNFGVTAHFQINNFLAVRPSVFYRFGAMSYSDDNSQKISLNRIAMPIPVMYSHIFPNGGILFGGAGPNLMYSLSGTAESNGFSEKISFDGDNSGMKRFDVGLNFTGGYQFAQGLSLSLFLNAGLTNLSKDPNYSLHSLDAFGFTIGWMFGAKTDE